MSNFGQNDAGDFDQLSITDVDFGTNYGEDYGINPNVLEGDYSMNGYSQQLGNNGEGEMALVPEGLGNSQWDQLGQVPAGLGHSQWDQLGTLPEGLGHHQQMGNHYQMGHHQQLGQMDMLTKPITIPFVNMQIPMWSAWAAGAAALYVANRQFRWVKLPF